MRLSLLLLLPLLLSGCNVMDSPAFRIGALVLAPSLLLIAVLWLLNRRGGEDKWEEDHFPDADDDDDNENHYLM